MLTSMLYLFFVVRLTDVNAGIYRTGGRTVVTGTATVSENVGVSLKVPIVVGTKIGATEVRDGVGGFNVRVSVGTSVVTHYLNLPVSVY